MIIKNIRQIQEKINKKENNEAIGFIKTIDIKSSTELDGNNIIVKTILPVKDKNNNNIIDMTSIETFKVKSESFENYTILDNEKIENIEDCISILQTNIREKINYNASNIMKNNFRTLDLPYLKVFDFCKFHLKSFNNEVKFVCGLNIYEALLNEDFENGKYTGKGIRTIERYSIEENRFLKEDGFCSEEDNDSIFAFNKRYVIGGCYKEDRDDFITDIFGISYRIIEEQIDYWNTKLLLKVVCGFSVIDSKFTYLNAKKVS